MKQFKTSEEFTQAAENQTLEGSGLWPAEKKGLQQPWHLATGDLPVPMTNDYLFRALMQKNNKVLKGLISALLHLPPSEISSAVIMNPIELGEAIDRKTFILDIKVSLNDSIVLSLEMQVVNEHNWAERSLSYMYRSFDQLNAGNKYQDMRPVIQIGIVNFSLFPESPEFYVTYSERQNNLSFTIAPPGDAHDFAKVNAALCAAQNRRSERQK